MNPIFLENKEDNIVTIWGHKSKHCQQHDEQPFAVNIKTVPDQNKAKYFS